MGLLDEIVKYRINQLDEEPKQKIKLHAIDKKKAPMKQTKHSYEFVR